uniref:Uncharacterized protein n=1 Tax=Oryza glumipatula TaxID=40148 RepID=A0A0D9YPB4_9ORYZ
MNLSASWVATGQQFLSASAPLDVLLSVRSIRPSSPCGGRSREASFLFRTRRFAGPPPNKSMDPIPHGCAISPRIAAFGREGNRARVSPPPPASSSLTREPTRLPLRRRRSRDGDRAEAQGEPLRRGRRDLRLRQPRPRRHHQRHRRRRGQPVHQSVDGEALLGEVPRDPPEAPHAPRVAAEGRFPRRPL